MCKCIHSWKQDEIIDGTHNMSPIQCSQYIHELESIVAAHAGREVLHEVQRCNGVEKTFTHGEVKTGE